MRKIALVIEHWGLGGTESYVKGLIKELLNNNYKVHLILLRHGAESNIDFLKKDYVQVVDVKDIGCYLREKEILIVNLHLYSSLLNAVCRLQVSNLIIISTLHMPINSWGLKQRLCWHLATRLSHIVVCVSPYITGQLSLNTNRVLTIPGGIDEVFLRNKRSERNLCKIFRIAAVGRLSQEKEWLTLLSAVNNLPNQYKKLIRIDFYGEGTQKKLLQLKVKESNINAHFYGHLPKDILAKELSNCSLSVLPSLFEGLGLSAIETMAVGIPTITSDFEASSFYISDGVNGNRFPIRDHKKLSDLIVWHIDNPEKSIDIGIKGRNSVLETFKPENTYTKYIELISDKVSLI